MRAILGRTLFLAAAIPAVSGCGSVRGVFRDRVPIATSAEDLGPINLAVVSVTRWQDVANDLRPALPIDRGAIFAQGVPTTATAAERIADILQARFALNFAGTSINDSQTVTRNATTESTSENGGDPTTSASETTGDNSSTARTRATPGAATLPEYGSHTMPSAPGTRATDMVVDPVTRATNAAAVIQSLVVINRSIDDAVRRTGYEPYLVRLQFGIQPRRREQPFDLKLRVAFLPNRLGVAGARGNEEATVFPAGDRLGPILGGPWLSGDAPADGDTVNRLDRFEEFRRHMDLLQAGRAHLLGSYETALSYRFRISNGSRAGNVEIGKACFFQFAAHYLAVSEGAEPQSEPDVRAVAERSYPLLASAARFSAGFLDRLTVRSPAAQCDDVPRYEEAWREIYRDRSLRLPIVVPLVQTDNLEGTREQFAAQQLRQAALTVSALGGGVSGGAGLNRTMDRINDYEGTRINSLYSVSRLAENTIQIHIGASRLGSRYEMFPRTVQATLLILVPREQAGDTLQLIARPSFDNAETGETLQLSSARTHAEGFIVRASIVDDFCFGAGGPAEIGPPCRSALTNLLRHFVERSDWSGFTRNLADQSGRAGYRVCIHPGEGTLDTICVAELWTELQREASRLRVMPRASVQLPAAQVRNLPPNQTAAGRLENGVYTVTLVGIDPWLQSSLRASLSGDCRAGTQGGGAVPSVIASKLSVEGNVGRFEFREVTGLRPTQLCLWIDDASFTPAALAIVNGFSARNPQSYPVALPQQTDRPNAAAAAPLFRIVGSDQRISLAAGQGVAHVVVSGMDKSKIDRIRLTSNGAILQVSEPGQPIGDLFAVSVAANARLSLTIGGLRAGGTARIVAQGMRGDANVGAEQVVEIDTN